MKRLADQSTILDRITIEPMQRGDLDQVMEIETTSYANPWTRGVVETELARSVTVSLVMKEAEEVIAYLIFWLLQEEIHILNLAVRPDRRERGLGRIFLEYMLDWSKKRGVRKAFLEVRVSNLAAQKLYESAGFIKVGSRENYYTAENEDALLMARRI
ncbi:MAG: ribosomal protein S18-alanine N-acetyltransferase [Deltaproteobacteria bacterium]|nr:ribosomal protein S18-alanine N-acetyltransferase [Deltaproteobacteria bacterium]